MHTDEPGMEKLGCLKLDFGEEVEAGRPLTVDMFFGKTTLVVKAKDDSSGNTVDTSLEFQAVHSGGK